MVFRNDPTESLGLLYTTYVPTSSNWKFALEHVDNMVKLLRFMYGDLI